MRAPGLKYVTHSGCVNCPYFIEPGHRNNLHLSSSPHLRSIIFKFIHPEISRYFHRMNHLTGLIGNWRVKKKNLLARRVHLSWHEY